MILPVKRNLTIYKGAQYEITFRVKYEDEYLALSTYTIRFRASNQPGGIRFWDFQTDTSPNYITVDADGYAVITIPGSVTDDAIYADMYYEIDLIKGGVVDRVLTGTILMVESA